MNKTNTISLIVIASIYIVIVSFYTNSIQSKKNNYLSEYTQVKEKQFQTIYNSFRKLAISAYYGTLSKPNITDIFEKVIEEDTDKNILRKELYKAVRSDYRKLRMLGMRYVNFHTPDGKCFLHMHAKNHFGDNLFRDSIASVTKNKFGYEGLEESGETTGFKFIYPVTTNEEIYIGSIETTFGTSEFINEFEKSFNSRARLIFHKESLHSNSFRDISLDYAESLENKNYLVKNSDNSMLFNDQTFIKSNDFEGIKEDVNDQMEQKKKFSIHFIKNDTSKIITLIPKYNESTQELIGYFVSYDSDTYLQNLDKEYIIIVSILSFILFLLGYITYREILQKEILQVKVKEKTAEVQELYNREHYLKNLLQTIANVNESLITTYSIGSIIESALKKLNEHEYYKLVTFGFLDKNKVHIRYVSGDIYSLITEKTIDLEVDYKEHILSGAIEAIHTDKTVINDNLNFDNYITSKNNRRSDYTLESSISILVKDQDSSLIGVITLFNTHSQFDDEEISLLEALVHDVSNAISASKQRTIVKRLQEQQISNYEETILAFVDMIEQRDAYTAGHTVRVAKYCRIVAEKFNIDEKEIIKLEKAAILHDIGKIATPDTILLKPGRLSNLEYSLIQEHSLAGYQMLSKVEHYKELAEIIIFHHEHYDGTGYPNHVKGNDIPFLAHILIVCDAFDAMTTNRIYKSRLTTQEAAEELAKCSGTQFHPEIANQAAKTLKDINIEHTSQLPTTTLEQQRFAYFFNDGLTSAHNEDYLLLMLHSSTKYATVLKIDLQKVGQYNKTYGWEKGNQMLANIGKYLKETYSNDMLFRYHGDDFVLLSMNKINFDKNQFYSKLKKYDIQYSITSFQSVSELAKELNLDFT